MRHRQLAFVSLSYHPIHRVHGYGSPCTVPEVPMETKTPKIGSVYSEFDSEGDARQFSALCRTSCTASLTKRISPALKISNLA